MLTGAAMPAVAQTAGGTAPPPTGMKNEGVQQRMDEHRKDRINRMFGRVVSRYEAALVRENRFMERIQSRIDKAKADGKDVIKAQAALDRAKTLWQEAKAALEAVKVNGAGITSAEDPKAAFQRVRTMLNDEKSKIKAVHAALVDAITVLKGIGGGSGNATSTPQ